MSSGCIIPAFAILTICFDSQGPTRSSLCRTQNSFAMFHPRNNCTKTDGCGIAAPLTATPLFVNFLLGLGVIAKRKGTPPPCHQGPPSPQKARTDSAPLRGHHPCSVFLQS